MNFNLHAKADYKLQGRHTNELINLYGIPTKLLLTEKIEYDSSVFGDFQSIKTNTNDVFDVMMMPETSETFDDISTNFSEFGMLNVETIRLFISRPSIEKIFDTEDPNNEVDPLSPVKKLIQNLVILPNNRVLEITDVEFMVPGINNLFTELDIKNVYKLTLKTYDRKLSDDISSLESENNETTGSYKELDSYFNELTTTQEVQDNEAKIEINTETQKPVVKEDDDVFGRF